MGQFDFEYTGLMAEAWDVLRGDTSSWADRYFYRKLIEVYGQPVLDVGCGTGRLLLDYMQQGVDIDGVDNSPEMLALCREKAQALGLAPTLYEQQMESLVLLRQYRTILVPSSSLQLVTDPAVVDLAMTRLVGHLLPGGVLAASFMTLWAEGEPLESESERRATREADGAVFRRVARVRYDPADGCEHTEDVYQKIVAGEVVEEEVHRRSPATRSYTQVEARALFARAGLTELRLYSEFTFEPVKPDDRLFVVTGQKGES